MQHTEREAPKVKPVEHEVPTMELCGIQQSNDGPCIRERGHVGPHEPFPSLSSAEP
jgi:hypothetical protein